MTPGEVPGLQRERTELSWRRTSAAVATGGLVMARLHADSLGAWSLVGLLPIVAMAWWVGQQGWCRHLAATAERASRPSDGVAGALVAGSACALAAIQLATHLVAVT